MERAANAFAAPIVIALTALIAGCGGPPPAPPAEPTPAWTYTIRGEVTALAEDGGARRLYVHHEAIPEFRVADEVVGMDSMTMPFELDPGIDVSGIAVGDKVAFDWQVGGETPSGRVVRLERLPADAELDLGDRREPASDAGGAAHE